MHGDAYPMEEDDYKVRANISSFGVICKFGNKKRG